MALPIFFTRQRIPPPQPQRRILSMRGYLFVPQGIWPLWRECFPLPQNYVLQPRDPYSPWQLGSCHCGSGTQLSPTNLSAFLSFSKPDTSVSREETCSWSFLLMHTHDFSPTHPFQLSTCIIAFCSFSYFESLAFLYVKERSVYFLKKK